MQYLLKINSLQHSSNMLKMCGSNLKLSKLGDFFSSTLVTTKPKLPIINVNFLGGFHQRFWKHFNSKK